MIRPQWGPVLLDYPYVYPIDEKKLYCTHVDPKTNIRCTGMIDYDDAFNYLLCRKCGTRYFASDLEDKNADNDIVISRGGRYPMKIRVTTSDGTIVEPIKSSAYIAPNKRSAVNKNTRIKIAVTGGNNDVDLVEEESTPVEEVEEIVSPTESVLNLINNQINADTEDHHEDEKTEEVETHETEVSEVKEAEIVEEKPQIEEAIKEEVVEKPEPKKAPSKSSNTKKSSSTKKKTNTSSGSKIAGGSKKAGKYVASPDTAD